MLKSFMPSLIMSRPSVVHNSAPAWTPPSTSGSSNSGSVRDDYDNPEDLWEDNQDWYEDEDEAWDEWYDG